MLGFLCSRGIEALIRATEETIASVSVVNDFRKNVLAAEHSFSTPTRTGAMRVSNDQLCDKAQYHRSARAAEMMDGMEVGRAGPMSRVGWILHLWIFARSRSGWTVAGVSMLNRRITFNSGEILNSG